jgi:hypothetical protein
MSLSQRITSLESLSPERGRSPSSVHRHKLSFNPLPGTWEEPGQEETGHQERNENAIGAFEVPKAKRICELIF